ncbi:MAG: glycosyltransferase [Bacillota bacterium]|nr:glycosyltransferase [Bacillota bacterium]
MKVAAVVPAYNEERTIGAVLSVLVKCRGLDEVVVVSDGSTDGTARVARSFGVKVVELESNRGKGAAMAAGVAATDAPLVVFLDADLVGLREEHVTDLVLPVIQGEADMTMGTFTGGRLSTDLAQAITPFLTGLRAMRRQVIAEMPAVEVTRYGVEVALTRHARRQHLRVKEVPLPGLSQVMKEEKLGFWAGFARRLRMYWEIIWHGLRA